ncbi:hypothetical protein [Paenibacillus marinisediminis]
MHGERIRIAAQSVTGYYPVTAPGGACRSEITGKNRVTRAHGERVRGTAQSVTGFYPVTAPGGA